MAWYNFWIKNHKQEPEKGEIFETQTQNQYPYTINGSKSYNPILFDIFDGEKTPGELGAVNDTIPDHLRLRLRAYEMNLKTDIVKIITGKFFKWVIGNGLKLQYEPNETVLNIFEYSEDLKTLRKNTEALFNLFATTDHADYNRKDSLHQKASDAFETAFLGGDCLCILRFTDNCPNIQVIDGQKISNPLDDTLKQNGNVIENGIEINKKGDHVAFWVEQIEEGDNVEHKRIKARNSNGNLVAWMVYGTKARPDHNRGIPVISSILEKIGKLDRFVEASVKKAEETANVVYAFVHKTNSTGENILNTSLNSKIEDNSEQDTETIQEKNGRTANYLRQSTSGTVLNLTTDSDIKSLSSDGEKNFEQFFRAVFCSLCAAVDIPEEVALQKYEQNYSSSRAAINGWEFLVEVYRHKFAEKFYKPIFKSWFEFNVLKGTLKTDSFLSAKANANFMALEAYYSSRFLGKKMPHIDPLKEAKAIRSLLGDSKAPLISHEQATELMNGGDWSENISKLKEELKDLPKEKDDTSKNENNGNNLEE